MSKQIQREVCMYSGQTERERERAQSPQIPFQLQALAHSDRLNKAKAWNVKINQSQSAMSPRKTRREGREEVSEGRAEEVSTRL